MSKNINIYCKVVLFGEEGCGKGKIKEFFLNYIEEKKNSIIASSETRKIDGLGENIEFEVWDTPGNRRYISTMIKQLLINANVVILVYDITNKETFFEIKYFWYNYIKENAPKDITFSIAANNYDLYEKQEVSENEANDFAKRINAYFFEVPSNNINNIDEILFGIGKKFLEQKSMEEKKINSMPVINEKINIEYINEYKIKINNLNQKLEEKEKIIQNLKNSISEELNINKELNKNLDIKNKTIKNIAKENENLKKELNKSYEKIKILNEKLKKLSKKDKIIESLLEKENEIKELKSKIQNYKFELKEEETLVNIIFMSADESIIYSSMCKNSDKFIDIEKNLYKKFPELLQSENDYFRKGNKINKYNSIDENKIKDGDILIFNIRKNI